MDKEKAKLALKHLIDRYNSNKNNKDFAGNESQIRRSLIEPFVRDVLGWNIEDPSEFKVESQVSGKRSDILVCLNGLTQFIIEAKSLSAELVDNNEFYKQAIAYAHSKEKTFAILANFRYFVILRCDVEVDNPLKAAIKIINIESYSDKDFDLLYNFNKQVWIEKGEENPLYLKLANYRRRIKVDIQLLEDLKNWRQSIINNLLSHPKQNKYDFSDEKIKYSIEEEVQRFIDRMIFVCYSEDKGFGDAELKSLAELKKDKYFESQSWLLDKIMEIFVKYWKEYNSDLFKPGECDKFFIEDSVLLKVLTDLRKPKDRLPYDFGSIEADILGKTYENFIGHVIAGEKRLKEKESRGKRKEMGIYYTPTYIVDYIVRNTVGEHINGKSFSSINKIKVLDPACGSGSFLIKAFDLLVEESKKALSRELNYEEKKGLMLNCIHGVDLDERAVDICKLNLSLKLAERGQKLPELHNNIKCGNSLIDNENIAGYKAFKWEDEFKEIMQNGWFDVVIGNPPYVKARDAINVKERDFIQNSGKFISTIGMWDLYIAFVELGLNLLKDKGNFSMIIPDTIGEAEYTQKLTDLILNSYNLYQIDFFPNIYVFEKVGVKNKIIFVTKNRKINCRRLVHTNKLEDVMLIDETDRPNNVSFKLELSKIDFNFGNCIPLWKICYVTYGLRLNSDKADPRKFSKSDLLSSKKDAKHNKIYTEGKYLDRYLIKRVLFVEWDTDRCPKRLVRPTFEELYHPTKLLMSRQKRIATISFDRHICDNTIIVGVPYISLKNIKNKHIDKYIKNLNLNRDEVEKNSGDFNLMFILSIINSKLMSYFLKFNSGGRIDTYPDDWKKIPIKDVSKNKQLLFITLCDKMLSLNKKLQEERLSQHEKEKIQQEIKKTDNEIDELVYQLYGITEEEKKIIEESLK